MFCCELWTHCAALSPGSHYFLKQAGKNLKNQYPFQRAIEVRVFIICRKIILNVQGRFSSRSEVKRGVLFLRKRKKIKQ